MNKQIDWAEEERRAEQMTDVELHYALLDIQKTLPHSDAMDRAFGTDNGGFYRDQASVYRREMDRRRGR